MSARGIRNNNPGNIRHVREVVWLGQSALQTDDSFVQFDMPVYGVRAIVRILRSYERKGIRTLREAISRWAPPNENDSDAYVSAVSAACHISPDDPLGLEPVMPALVKAIIRHENGELPYTDELIAKGIEIA